MHIGGFQKVSFLDFPDTIASVVFTQGCNWRCPWCHNPNLVYPDQFEPSIPESEILSFLKNRTHSIEGVVVSGGEPTLHNDLADFFKSVRELGFKTKLDTNGSNPDHLQRLLSGSLIDFVAMDIKSAPETYSNLVGVPVNLEKIKASIQLIQSSGIAHEFRSTRIPHLHTSTDYEGIQQLIGASETITWQDYVQS